jgi:hypothetical protein
VVVAALGAAAAPALASRLAYAAGAYTAKVKQTVPRVYSGAIGFRVHHGKLTNLRFTVTMVCARVLIAQVQSPPSTIAVSIAPNGSFSYSGVVSGTSIQLHGAFHGRNVHGKFFESFHTGAGSSCTMLAPAPFGTRL